MVGPLHLKVFLSSPGDVAAERELARRLIKDELAYDPLLRGRVTFDVFSWDDPAAGVPLLATMTPQEAVNRIDRPADCDITIVILWSRLGSPLRTDAFRKPDGEPYWSGTEWEYEDARAAGREVLVYQRTEKVLLDDEAADFEERREQRRRVRQFFERFRNADGSFNAGFATYEKPKEFKRKLEQDLRALVDYRLRALAQASAKELGTAKSPLATQTHNLPPHNPDFVGREQPLKKLRRLLTSGQGPAVLTQAITGLGGIGKTQTALAYCYRHLADYRLIWWLRAESAGTLAADYATLAEALGLDPAVADQEKLLSSIRTALPDHAPCLLVFDNVEDPALPRAYLPRTGGHALITSRRTDWSGIAKTLPLELMPEAEALQLLTTRPDPEALPTADLAEAKALARKLGCLPLALAQAQAYMHEAVESFEGYRALLAASGSEMLREGRAHPDYPEPVARTWDLSIRAAEQQCPAARPLLELLAFLAPETLPRAVLDAKPDALPESLRDKLARNRAIGALVRFSLIGIQDGSIVVHRLVQAVTRDELDEATAKARAEAAVQLVDAAWPGAPWEYTLWPRIGTLLPHVLASTGEAEQLGVALQTTATLLNNIALYHNARAAYAEAEPLFQRAIAIGEKTLGPEHPNFATQLNNLANLYRDTGRDAEAATLYQRAIAIDEKTLGPNHPGLATDLNNLAELYRDTGRYAEAEPLYQRAIAIGEKTLGPEHPRLATWLNNLAGLYRDTGRYAEAEPLFTRAIAIDEKVYGPKHPELARHLWNLAALYVATERWTEAELLYQRVLTIFGETLPTDHPHIAQAREQYALLLNRLGRGGEAAALRAQAGVARPHEDGGTK
jgi:tetratricopeptide (TPR) repeat protein